MHDGMQYDPIQGQDQGYEPFKFGNPAIFKSYPLRHFIYLIKAKGPEATYIAVQLQNK